MNESKIPVSKSNKKANFPYLVQYNNTENWNTHSAKLSLQAALKEAEAVQQAYPALPVRVLHCTGGWSMVTTLPLYKQMQAKEIPVDDALWSGKQPPPPVGARVKVLMNDLGYCTVDGYAVSEGYLAVVAKADEERPAWHKNANPDNEPSLLFGCEIEYK